MVTLRLAAASLLLLSSIAPLHAQRERRPPPSELAARCGTQIAWERKLEAALERAQAEKKPVLWYVPSIPGTPMDRKEEIDRYMLFGPFATPSIVDMIQSRYVPLRQVPGGKATRERGLVPGKFIEPGIIVLDPEGKELLRIDKITTQREEWFMRMLRRPLKGFPFTPSPGSRPAGASPAERVRALLAAGDWEMALKMATAWQDGGAERDLLIGSAWLALHEEEPARKALAAAAQSLPAADVQLARLELGRDRADAALVLLDKVVASSPADDVAAHARYLRGVALHLLNRTADGDAAWRGLGTDLPQTTWAAKAAAELERHGPFIRGFEEYAWLPADAFVDKPDGTRVPRTEADLPRLRKASVRYLLHMQRENGSWDDSWYDFGGLDSMPNVWMAITALASAALLGSRSEAPEAIDKALDRAEAWMRDESHVNPDDDDEIAWAHVYRVFYDARAIAGGRGDKAAHLAHMKAVTESLVGLQKGSGIWRHEYDNPFVSASALHALHLAEQNGITVDRAVVQRGLAALLRTRADNGGFTYGFAPGENKPRTGIAPAAGRMPLCEVALLMWGASDQDKLGTALRAALEHHHYLEETRKYDNHATLAYGGFFFWYDMLGRQLAIERVEDKSLRAQLSRKQKDLILAIPEIDGAFVDSHELGKSYGTAMALLCLGMLEK